VNTPKTVKVITAIPFLLISLLLSSSITIYQL
jgi:hypothetical protein